MYIETPRMLIRGFCLDDAADLHEIFSDAETMENCEPAYDPAKTKDFLSSFCISRQGALAAVHKDSGKMIGYILFNEYEEGVYEIGWIFNRRFWRQGYAYEVCLAILDYMYENYETEQIYIFIEPQNSPSIHLAKKLGAEFYKEKCMGNCDGYIMKLSR